MIVYAAIDLRAGRVVQLVGGRPDQERLRLPDPVAVARDLAARGFAALHVVDLDGALDEGSNAEHVAAIIDAVALPVQVGGGIRDRDALARWLTLGADKVIVGTRAIEEPEWLATVAKHFPDRILVAADVRDEVIVTHGWTRDSGLAVGAYLGRVASLPLAGLLVTDVGREGQLVGIDTALFARLARESPLPIIAAGGIRSPRDLHRLEDTGVAGAVVGTALYTGAIVNAEAFTEDFRK